VTTLSRKLGRRIDPELKAKIDECSNSFAREHIDLGATQLSEIILMLPKHADDDGVSTKILNVCTRKLKELMAGRLEYLLLALHTLHVSHL
jgi:hypothetical protein